MMWSFWMAAWPAASSFFKNRAPSFIKWSAGRAITAASGFTLRFDEKIILRDLRQKLMDR
jgi:hypothetical protein